MKRQVLVIGGGDSYRSYKEFLAVLKSERIDFKRNLWSKKRDWKGNLQKTLGKKYEVIIPQMPNRDNAQYNEWEIWFEKFIPYLRHGVVLIGHSLGAMFLIKYLSEVKFSKKIRATLLVAAPFGAGDFDSPDDYDKLIAQGGRVIFYHSKDDHVVRFSDFKRYQREIEGINSRILNKRGHFNKEKFPELVRDLRGAFRTKSKK